MFRFAIVMASLLIVTTAQAQVKAQTGKKISKYQRVVGISDPFPLLDKKKQRRWFLKWVILDKMPDAYMRQFMDTLKEEQEPWKKALDTEKLRKEPRARYIKYYNGYVKWHDDMHVCVESLAINKLTILPIKDNPQPAYVKKKSDLILKNKELIKEFRKVIARKPKKAKKRG